MISLLIFLQEKYKLETQTKKADEQGEKQIIAIKKHGNN